MAVSLQVILSFYAQFVNSILSNTPYTYGKFISSNDYCFAYHEDKVCYLFICKYSNTLTGDIEEMLQKVDAFCFTHQHVSCLCTLYKYGFGDQNVAKSGQMFDSMQRAVYSYQRTKRLDKMHSIEKKDSREKSTGHFLSYFQRTKSTQTSAYVFLEKIESTKMIENYLGCW